MFIGSKLKPNVERFSIFIRVTIHYTAGCPSFQDTFYSYSGPIGLGVARREIFSNLFHSVHSLVATQFYGFHHHILKFVRRLYSTLQNKFDKIRNTFFG